MKRKYFTLSILSLAFFVSCKKQLTEDGQTLNIANGGNPNQAIAASSDSAEHVPNQLLVRFKRGTSASGRNNALARITGRVEEHIVTRAMQQLRDNDGIYVVNTPLRALEALSKLKGGEEIETVELNYIYQHCQTTTTYTSNDTYYTNGSLWGMYSDDVPVIIGPSKTTNQWGSQAEKAWANGNIGSSTVYIGVIDEGVMDKHRDLVGNVEAKYGWDFANNDATTYDGPGDDHGTHVAGTIGAVGGNSEGVAGVCWKVKMVPAKFIGSRGGSTTNAIKAIDHFTSLKNSYLHDPATGLNIVATSNSWGGGGYSKEMELAIDRAEKAGILFVCAAGNDGRNIDASGSHSFPACYYNGNIIAVCALTSNGSLATYSNYGQVGLNQPEGWAPHSFVDIGAPGSGVYSTVPGKNGASSYASYNGTSMATPHVTGAVALYKAKYSNATWNEIKDAIFSDSKATTSLNNKCITSGRLYAGGF